MPGGGGLWGGGANALPPPPPAPPLPWSPPAGAASQTRTGTVPSAHATAPPPVPPELLLLADPPVPAVVVVLPPVGWMQAGSLAPMRTTAAEIAVRAWRVRSRMVRMAGISIERARRVRGRNTIAVHGFRPASRSQARRRRCARRATSSGP
jgi:hypothetical protein